jgi:hypothetical protein
MAGAKGKSAEPEMTKTTQGKVNGRTIELSEDLGLAEGQQVEVQVKVLYPTQQWGEGLRRCAGALAKASTDEDDRILAAIYLDRKCDTWREISE